MSSPSSVDRVSRLRRRGFVLEWVTLSWNVVGVIVLAVRAISASSTALARFGLDSLIEIGVSTVVLWELSGTGGQLRRRALRLIGVAFIALAVYLLVQSAVALITQHHPAGSVGGIAWTAIIAVCMFTLAALKTRTGLALGNAVLGTEGHVTFIDGLLAVAVLLGVTLNTVFGWWWADPLAGLVIVYYPRGRGNLQTRHPRVNSNPGRPRFSQRRRLAIVLALNVALIGGLATVGIAARSVGVLAAAGDTLADSAALTLGLIAVALRDRNPDDPRAGRPIALVALINATLLIAVTIGVTIEAIIRLVEGPPAVLGLPMAVVSLVTLAVMIAGALVLDLPAHREDIHMKSVLIDTLANAAAAAGVLAAGIIIWLTDGLYWLDPVIALILAVVIGYTGTRLAMQAVAALRGADIDFDND